MRLTSSCIDRKFPSILREPTILFDSNNLTFDTWNVTFKGSIWIRLGKFNKEEMEVSFNISISIHKKYEILENESYAYSFVNPDEIV